MARDCADAVPGHVSGTARRQPRRQGAGCPASGRWKRAISVTPPPTATAASTTPRPAAARAWYCAPTCWRPRSTPLDIAPDRPTPVDEPAGSAIDPVAGRGTRRRPGPADRLRPVRGRRRAGHPGPPSGRGLDRGLCAFRRRNRRHGPDRRLRPAIARRDGQSRPRGRRKASPTAYWNTPNIPVRRSSRGSRSRKSWFPATMPR